jgi:hypothetical protein
LALRWENLLGLMFVGLDARLIIERSSFIPLPRRDHGVGDQAEGRDRNIVSGGELTRALDKRFPEP